MAAPNPVDGAAARLPADFDIDEPMDVDPQVMELMKVAMGHSRPTVEDIRRTVGRKPGEDITMGDMQYLGEMITNRLILSPEVALNARQIEAEDEAARRRREMAADADFSDELNDMFDELSRWKVVCPPTTSTWGNKSPPSPLR